MSARLAAQASLDTSQYEQSLERLKKKNSEFSSDSSSSFRALAGRFAGVTAAIAGVAVALVKTAKAADVQAQAEAKLLTALGGRVDVQQRLIKQAGELQSKTVFGDEAIINQQGFLAALGLTEEQINKTIMAATELAAATGMTLESAVKNLSKTYGGLTGELGESIPALKNLTEQELRAGKAIEFINKEFKGFAETAARTGLGPAKQLTNSLGDLSEAIGARLTPDLGRAASAINALVGRLTELINATNRAKQIEESRNNEAKKTIENLKEQGQTEKQIYDTTVQKIDALKNEASLLDGLASGRIKYAEYDRADQHRQQQDAIRRQNAINFEISKLQDIIKLTKSYAVVREQTGPRKLSEAEQKFASDREAALKGVQDVFEKLYLTEEQLVRNKTNKQIAELQRVRLAEENLSAEIITLKEAEAKELDRLRQERFKKDADIFAQITGFAANLLGSFSQIAANVNQQQQNNLDDYAKKEKAAIEASTLSEEQKARAIQSLEEDTAKKKAELQRKAAEDQKVFSIFTTILNTSAAIVKALTDPGGIAGGVLAGVYGALGAAQIAAIQSQPLPSFAVGTLDVPRDMLANIHQNEMIVPASMSQSIRDGEAVLSAGAMPMRVTVNLGSKTLYDDISYATQTRDIIIHAGAVV